jgi:hypothetical protein
MGLVALAVCAQANAAGVDVAVTAPRQVGTTDRASVGIAVDATTNTMWLTAGGGYTLTCPDTTALEAQRALQFLRWPAGFRVVVTVPEVVPAEYRIAGWQQWQAPSTHTCTFKYVGRAKDGLLNIFGSGINISFGGDEASEGDSLTFAMVKNPPPPPPGGGIPCISCTCTPP